VDRAEGLGWGSTTQLPTFLSRREADLRSARDLAPNPSLQRTTTGRSPGRCR
jgi:hypothetical protein